MTSAVSTCPARLALRVHRRRKQTGKRENRETVYAVTSADAHQATAGELARWVRGHWIVENSSHHIRDVTFGEDASTVHAGSAPRVMATVRNLAIGALKTLKVDNIAKTTRAIRDDPARALPIYGITSDRTLQKLERALPRLPTATASDSASQSV
ncbi:transposase [Streptomonospora salina]|uniref:Putative transposase YbfD/YdcC n=1 Tax=Streptomonospora salina TaxID=104205 RepID=A0A841EFA2_9ACTN|nr:transposase [Streptomonospora salina]MBB6000009.1 putative transposase YbfD/YdcC [Streptomonospora salina]